MPLRQARCCIGQRYMAVVWRLRGRAKRLLFACLTFWSAHFECPFSGGGLQGCAFAHAIFRGRKIQGAQRGCVPQKPLHECAGWHRAGKKTQSAQASCRKPYVALFARPSVCTFILQMWIAQPCLMHAITSVASPVWWNQYACYTLGSQLACCPNESSNMCSQNVLSHVI